MTRCRSRAERGATLLEAAIVLPIFFTLVFLIIELARLAAVHANLEAAANEALNVARVTKDLDIEDSEDQAAQRLTDAQQRITDAIAAINTKSLASSYSAALNIPGLPLPAAGKTRADELAEKPIEIILTSQFRSFIPFVPPVTVISRAIGYREPRGYYTNPIAVDCLGTPLLPGQLIKDGTCKCPNSNHPAAYFSPAQNKCMCLGDHVFAGNTCNCPAGEVDANPADNTFYCDCLSPPTCLAAEDKYRLPNSCSCSACPVPARNKVKADGSGCECDTSICHGPDMFFDSTNVWYCNCTKKCFNGTLDAARSTCTCDPVFVANCRDRFGGNGVVTSECKCTPCEGGAQTNGFACVCPADPSCTGERSMVYNSTASPPRCECVCPSTKPVWIAALNKCAPAYCASKTCLWNGVSWVLDE